MWTLIMLGMARGLADGPQSGYPDLWAARDMSSSTGDVWWRSFANWAISVLRWREGDLQAATAAAKESLEVETLRVVADTGYCSREQVRRCVAQGIEPNVPPKHPPVTRQGLYPLEAFRYEPEKDAYLCPNNRMLTRHSDVVRESVTYQMYYSTVACRGCPLLAKCTKGKYRKLAIAVNDEAMKAMEERARTQPELQRQRSQTVEHVFGTIKFWWGFRSFLCRGLQAVQAEFSMTALAYNFRRVLNVLGAEGLLEALRARQAA
jgi:hypothetical protein